MCVAVPMRVQEIVGTRAILESRGVVTEADISLLDAVEPGDYVLVHAGIAITRLDKADAEETLSVFASLEADTGLEPPIPNHETHG